MNMNNLIEKLNNDEIINQVKKCAKNEDVYLVGGAIRDFYLEKENFDKDIIINAENTEEIAREIAQCLCATFVPLDEVNKIYRLVLPDRVNFVDIACLMGDNLTDDLRRRDLTINSIAINLKTMELLDLNDGINDLKNKKIRHISEQNFSDDPLRLLRVFRFAATLGFAIDDELFDIVKKHVTEINRPAIERINYELLKMFSGNFASETLLKMDESGILKLLFPVIEEVKKVPPNSHHHLDLFHHSIETVKQVETIFNVSSPEVKGHLEMIEFGGFSRITYLKLAAFLHDIGKPQTWTIEPDTGRHRFIKHDDLGAKLCHDILKKNKFSKKQIEYVSKMVKNHIYPSHVISAPEVNEKIYMRFIRKMEAASIDIIILAMADRYSARGVEITDEVINKNIGGLQALLDYYLSVKDGLKPLPKLLSGEEIMILLNMKPSVQVGEIIKSLQEEQLAGNILTKEKAIEFVKSRDL